PLTRSHGLRRGDPRGMPTPRQAAGQAPLLSFPGEEMSDVNMPKLSDTMEEGTVVEWKKKSGETVKKGDVIAEVESDKATFDLESEADGVLDIIVQQGVPAKIGAPIARIGAAGEAPAPKAAAPKEEAPKPAAKTEKPKGAD